jgi:hypothetical protein
MKKKGDLVFFECFDNFFELFRVIIGNIFRFTEIGSWPYDPEIAYSQN